MKKTPQQILAILGIILLVGLTMVALVLAIIGSEYFMGVMALVIIVPVFLWVFIMIFKNAKKKDDDSDFLE